MKTALLAAVVATVSAHHDDMSEDSELYEFIEQHYAEIVAFTEFDNWWNQAVQVQG